MMIGLPVDGREFAKVVPLLADGYTVVTYDPRGISRSTIVDPEQDSTPALVADDVHRVLAAVTTELAYVFGSSGGAVTGLELVRRHPEQVRTLVAHESPLIELLPDAAEVRAAMDDVYDTYRRDGPGAARKKFLALAGFEVPSEDPTHQAREPPPPSAQAVANGNRMFAHCLLPIARYRPDLAALRAAPSRIVVGGGKTSVGQLAHRTAVALAGVLATPLVEFPGGHEGFVGEPQPFAHTLSRVFTEAS